MNVWDNPKINHDKFEIFGKQLNQFFKLLLFLSARKLLDFFKNEF